VLAHAQGVVGGGQKRVSPAVHRRRAGVVGLAHEDHARAAHAHDRLDDADRDTRFLEARALLDVELDVGGDRAAGTRASGARCASNPALAIASTSRTPSTAAISSSFAPASIPQNAREPNRLP